MNMREIQIVIRDNQSCFNFKLDVDPQRDDDASQCRHIGHVESLETYLNVDFSSSAQVKIQVEFNFEFF